VSDSVPIKHLGIYLQKKTDYEDLSVLSESLRLKKLKSSNNGVFWTKDGTVIVQKG